MKVSVTDFRNALSLFEAKVITTQSTKMNKFAMGVALSFLNQDADKMLERFLDDAGMVDVGAIRAAIKAGMKAVGDDVLDMTPEFDPKLRLFGVTIKTIKITKDDFDEFFDKIIPQVSPTAIQ